MVLERTRRYGFPVLGEMDFRHTQPQLTLPLGCRARLDAGPARLEIPGGAVTAKG